MKFCPNCGARLSDGMKFCTECGAKVMQPEPPVQAAYTPPAEPVYEPPVQAAYIPPAEPVYEPPVQAAYPPPAEPVYEPPVQAVYPPPAEPVYEPPVQAAYPPPAEPVYEPPVQTAYVPPVTPPKPPVYSPQTQAGGGQKQSRKKKPANKKTMRIAAIGAAAVLVIVLLVVLLGGRAQGTDAQWGRYEAVSAKSDGGAVSVDGEWIELQKTGKATICIMGSEFRGKWKLDGTKFTLEQSSDVYTGTLQDGVLRINLVGTDYVFAKDGASTGPVTYKAISCISHGQVLDEELMDLIGGCYLVFHGDGTGELYLFGEKVPVTYDASTVTVDGETASYTQKDTTMELTLADGSSFNLQLTTEDPADASASTFNWETEAWEETDMETELLSYLNWPGQVFSTMDLSDASLSLEGTWGEAVVWFKTDADGNSVVEQMNFYVEAGTYEDLREMLIRSYGEPTEEGEEPYAESNGGAVTYCWFNHPAGTLRLSAASEQDFLEILVNTK